MLYRNSRGSAAAAAWQHRPGAPGTAGSGSTASRKPSSLLIPNSQRGLQKRPFPHRAARIPMLTPDPGASSTTEPGKHTLLLPESLALRSATLAPPKQEEMPPWCPEIDPKHMAQDEDTLSENISAGCFQKGLGTWPLPSWAA